MRLTRMKHAWLLDWWLTVDRTLLSMFGTLLAFGVVLSMAASPSVAERIGIADDLHFVKRQIVYAIPAFGLMIVASMLSIKAVRRIALLVFVVSLGLMALTLMIGPEVKGAQRWLPLFGFTLQPSEFAKPAFVVLAGWAFSQSAQRQDVPAFPIALGLLSAIVGLLLLQPDLGQTILVCAVWGALFFLSGMPLWTIGVLGSLAIVGIAGAYYTLPHVASRIDRFINPDSGENYQVDRALESFQRGGFLGEGPGEGSVKLVLPDAHTDFIFAVIGEEFGIIACLLLVAFFGAIMLRGMGRALIAEDVFQRVAGGGLIALFGTQALINFGVNLQLLPAKGMTLPFLSYGGSSLLAMGFGMGCALALLRLRPRDYRTTLAPNYAGVGIPA